MYLVVSELFYRACAMYLGLVLSDAGVHAPCDPSHSGEVCLRCMAATRNGLGRHGVQPPWTEFHTKQCLPAVPPSKAHNICDIIPHKFVAFPKNSLFFAGHLTGNANGALLSAHIYRYI